MHFPTNEFGLHNASCRFCNSNNTFFAGTSRVCAECGKVLKNRPFKAIRGGSTVYLRKTPVSFAQFCDDNWITWTDHRNVDGYVWIKEERDVWNALVGMGLRVSFSEYSPHFHGPAWMLAADGPLDNLIIKSEKLSKGSAHAQLHEQINDNMSETVSAKASPSC